MATLSQIVKDRKSALRQLSQLLKVVDTEVELQQRLIARLRSRKIKLPEVADLQKLTAIAGKMDASFGAYVNGIKSAVVIFGA